MPNVKKKDRNRMKPVRRGLVSALVFALTVSSAQAETLADALIGAYNNSGLIDSDAFLNGAPQPNLNQDGYSLYRIGDAVSSRNAAAAFYDALRLCATL